MKKFLPAETFDIGGCRINHVCISRDGRYIAGSGFAGKRGREGNLRPVGALLLWDAVTCKLLASHQVFAPLLELLPRRAFDAAVKRYGGQKKLRRFSCMDQLLASDNRGVAWLA